jgi:hypothetical protein
MTRQCLQSKRSNKLGRAGRHHDVHGTILLRQFAGYISSFVRRNRSCHSEDDVQERFHSTFWFADLFQLGFALDDNLGDLGVVCFSAERIQLAAEFLADELKRLMASCLFVVSRN